MDDAGITITPARRSTCEWCGTEFEDSPRGRSRKYCSQSCRQRAYEARKGIRRPVVAPEGGLSGEQAQRLGDGLFELRCAAEDVRTAVLEGADPGQVADMCGDIVQLARRLEHLG
ncbi:hypothetical protein [Corynebacterium sp.]|uniref:hypothetical protein n=1 Tax=Corynebacterium sp. TaxID=1720 RepID=UPI0026DD73A1|nr:hypothetical protein [Corynebacterium sp.]MDO4609312.1 hypothetical protein [Corynebacterium sp.]